MKRTSEEVGSRNPLKLSAVAVLYFSSRKPRSLGRCGRHCNWIWLENLNLRGSYKTVIFDYVKNHYPHLISLYEAIYKYGDHSYWKQLDEKIRYLTQKENLLYVRDDDAINLPLDAKPIVVNYFFHNEITPSAKRKQNHTKTF